jgi:AAA ATPase domain
MGTRNPFADFGTTITHDRFLGREEELRQIDSRVFGPGGYGSLALVGLPKIGKTSLVAEAVRRAEPRLAGLRAAVVRLDVGTCGSVAEMFRALVEDLLETMKAHSWSNELIEDAGERVIGDGELAFPRLRGFFRAIRQSGVRAVCVLDEFDAGRYVFAGVPQCFHWLRELCSNPEFKAAVVLVSKRRLQDVARIAGHESDYWANVLMAMTLRPFSPEDTDLVHARLTENRVVAPEETREEARAVCGRHPYLLDAYAYHAWQACSERQELTLGWFQTTMRATVRDYYQQVVTILRDTPALGKFVQVMLGPQWNVTADDVDAMVDYGLLGTESGGRLLSFSSGFDDYVRFVEGSVEMWPLWRDTERVLREDLERALKQRFGEEWVREIKNARPKLRGLIEGCEHLMAKEQARFGARASSSLLAYTYPMDLFNLMAADWSALGEPLLGPDKQGWSIKFGVLAKVRTPLAHNREEAVQEGERLQAEGVCREILGRCETSGAWPP